MNMNWGALLMGTDFSEILFSSRDLWDAKKMKFYILKKWLSKVLTMLKKENNIKKPQNYYLLNNEWGCIVDSQ